MAGRTDPRITIRVPADAKREWVEEAILAGMPSLTKFVELCVSEWIEARREAEADELRLGEGP